MFRTEQVDVMTLELPEALHPWVAHAPVYESSGHSGAKTVYVDRDEGHYLKIAPQGSLRQAARMQTFFSERGMSSPVLYFLSADRDYLITSPLQGENGISEKHLSEPEHLSEIFGRSLRALHEVDIANCPEPDRMASFLRYTPDACFSQSRLDDMSAYIGPASAEDCLAELQAGEALLRNEVLMHGDYCLPNIMLTQWTFSGFVDVADGGVGDRHYDLAWGLWTLHYNLKTQRYGQRFLDAYGWDCIDRERLRLCGLLAAMD